MYICVDTQLFYGIIMKQLKFFLYIIIGAFMAACSNDAIMDDSVDEFILSTSECHRISQLKAVEIANNFIASIDKSTERQPTCDVTYVLNEKSSRGLVSFPDTLAYVINYPDNKGFVIVCADNKMNPILAFSESGSFSFENDAVMETFVDNIASYIEKGDTMEIDTGLQLEFGFKQVAPKIKTILDQESPFDKYVIVDNPGCPVGCVAVATALIMSHCESEVVFNGHHYIFPSIVEAIYNHQQPFGRNLATHGLYSEISYENAIDEMAFLLYEIGKNIGMEYAPGESSAYTSKAADLLKELGYEFSSGQLYNNGNYDWLTDYLIEDNIILTSGSGHAWVIDGVYYKLNDSSDRSKYVNKYFHCDWGWNGYSNGYYSGDVFTISNGDKFRINYYYPVKAHIKY